MNHISRHDEPLNVVITLCLFNIAMEHGPSMDDVPIKTSICKWFPMAMLVITRW